MDWSDHALWWPEKNAWLDQTRFTLDQYNITADAVIQFTPMHKQLRIQLPDLRYVDCTVDFSRRTFNASINLCKELGIRHPEELSLCKPLEPQHLKENYQRVVSRERPPPPTKEANTGERADTNTFIRKGGRQYHSNGSLNGGTLRSAGTSPFYSNPGTMKNNNGTFPTNGKHQAKPQSPLVRNGNNTLNASAVSEGDLSLAHSPAPEPQVRKMMAVSCHHASCSFRSSCRCATRNCNRAR